MADIAIGLAIIAAIVGLFVALRPSGRGRGGPTSWTRPPRGDGSGSGSADTDI